MWVNGHKLQEVDFVCHSLKCKTGISEAICNLVQNH